MHYVKRSAQLSGLIVATVLILTLFFTPLVSAHEHRDVGEYEISVGFLNEPAVLEEPNGLELGVAHGHEEEGVPVEGLAETLQAEVIYGDQSMPLTIEPVFETPGAYKADFIPTATGAYTFHITGSIEGTPVDESFTSSPDTFSEVEDRSALTFPNNVKAVGAVAADASKASDDAATAQTLSVVAIIVGVLGFIAAVVALVFARRTASPAAHDTTA